MYSQKAGGYITNSYQHNHTSLLPSFDRKDGVTNIVSDENLLWLYFCFCSESVMRAELELLDANGGDQVVKEGVAGDLQIDLTHQVNHVGTSPGHLLLSDE